MGMRTLCTKFGLSPNDLDRYKKCFKSVDSDNSDAIDFDEFKCLLQKLLKIPYGLELSEGRAKMLWAQADADGSGSVDFEEFINFYTKNFDDRADNESDPLLDFYQSTRQLSHVECREK